MFREDGGRPNDRRGFLHKSFIGRAVGRVVKTVIPAVGIGSEIVSAIRGGGGGRGGGRTFGRGRGRPLVPRTSTARVTALSGEEKEGGKRLKFPLGFGGIPEGAGGDASPCRTGESTRCCRLRNGTFEEQRAWQRECGTAGNGRAATGVGEAVMGQFGAALEPGVMVIERSTCIPGMQLGKDGLCYNKGAITNSERMWPRGRRPLLTGGDMRAIGIAARAGSKLDRTTKRLRALGMMKPLPKGRGASRHPALRIPVHKSVDV